MARAKRLKQGTGRVLLGVSGGIAAYKSLELVRAFRRRGWEVQVVMTASARRIIGMETFSTLSGRKVAYELFPRKRPADRAIEHIDLARWADLILVAPATANIIGKLAGGIADDLLSTLLLAVPARLRETGRVIIAPAMNTRMWQHPSVADNLARLAGQGYSIVAPEPGDLACGETGPGRMAAADDILAACLQAADGEPLPDLDGYRVLVTAGRTEEPLDPVRVLTNRSSGRLGIDIARTFRLARADVRLVAGAVSVALPAGIPLTTALSSQEMLDAVLASLGWADLLVMCAAVSDYRPARVAKTKRRAARLSLALEKTPDILKQVNRNPHGATVIGFSHDPSVAVARRKLRAKGIDLVVANPYETAGSDSIRATLVRRTGPSKRLPGMTKRAFAARLAREAKALLDTRRV